MNNSSVITTTLAAKVNLWSIPAYVGDYYLSIYAYSLCFLVGVPSSALACLILFNMPSNPSIAILQVTCVADFVMLFVGLPNRVFRASLGWAIRKQSTVGCQLHYGIVHYSEIALYYEALFSIVRVTSLWLPLRAQSIFSLRRTWAVIIALALFQLLKTVFQVLWMGLPSCDYLIAAVGEVFTMVDLSVVFAAPFAIDIVCTVMVVLALRKMTKNRNLMNVGAASGTDKQSKSSASLTQIMIVTNVSVFLTYGPYRLVIMLDQYLGWQITFAKDLVSLQNIALIEDILALLTYWNHANILFYLLVGKTFRDEAYNFVFCKKRK